MSPLPPLKDRRKKNKLLDGSDIAGTGGIRPAKLADAIATHLETLILEGSLRAGDRLLPERDLAAKLDVSRPSLREALDLLEGRGLLVSGRSGTCVTSLLGGTFSAPLTRIVEDHPNSTGAYLAFRGGMEGASAYFAALRASKIDREHMTLRFEEMKKAHANGDPAAEALADARFHLAIYEASHNLMMLHVMTSLSQAFHDAVFFNRGKLYQYKGVREILLEQHRIIADAIVSGDADAARLATEAHISFTKEALQEIDRANQVLESSLRRIVAGEENGKKAGASQ